ncbi:biopolymer transporter ExbD [Pelagibius sp. Alg239-R121]|uniref:ExbD/TolR family protein n=1 Tax=Pelagibius sp. Alg239-R121 TaxID=2993448 RepID=UPI0024A6A274|nr:biopolymer transporter ExbD [Pelagibius sp. Alg239-R121]
MNPQTYALSPPGNKALGAFGGCATKRRQLISLTPLIDVVFILLVFFMLASSFLDWRSIDLNTPGKGRSEAQLEGAVLVEVRNEGLRLSGEAITHETLIQRMRENSDRRVLVKPAQGVVMQDTVAVLDSLATAGVSDLSLIADQAR